MTNQKLIDGHHYPKIDPPNINNPIEIEKHNIDHHEFRTGACTLGPGRSYAAHQALPGQPTNFQK